MNIEVTIRHGSVPGQHRRVNQLVRGRATQPGAARGQLHDVHEGAQRDKPVGDHRRRAGGAAAQRRDDRRSAPWCALAGFAGAHGAVHAHRCLRLALRADCAPAALAEHKTLAIRMSVAEVAGVLCRVGHRIPFVRPAPRRQREAEPVLYDAGYIRLDLVDGDAVDDDVLDRTVAGIRSDGLDRVDDLLGGFVVDLAEDRVLALQPGGGDGGDEELRAVGAAGPSGCRRWPWPACTAR